MVNLFYKRQNKKGQAAIEFLMTYGWMLLVVLIVGALIFSIVDFGNLLPNTVELNNNFRAEPTQTRAIPDGSGLVLVTFAYNGNERVTITNGSSSQITGQIGETCNLDWIKNTETDVSTNGESASNFGIDGGTSDIDIVFLRGHSGLLRYNCSAGSPLIDGDILEGEITLQAEVSETSFPIKSSGAFRVGIE